MLFLGCAGHPKAPSHPLTPGVLVTLLCPALFYYEWLPILWGKRQGINSKYIELILEGTFTFLLEA